MATTGYSPRWRLLARWSSARLDFNGRCLAGGENDALGHMIDIYAPGCVRDGAAWLRSCKPAARGRRRLHVRDRPHQTDKSIGSVDRGRHGGVNLSWPSDR